MLLTWSIESRADAVVSVSFARHAKRVDTSQKAIVEALRRAGWLVWTIERPVDLLVYKPSRGFLCLECKTARGKREPKAVIDKRQKEQIEFIEATGTQRVCDPFEALLAVGEVTA